MRCVTSAPVSLCVCAGVLLSVCPSVSLCVCVRWCPPVCVSISPSVCVRWCPPVCVSISPSVCPRSWNAFHVCASSALAGCPGDAAAVWESLRQESRKTEFSGNLYDLCASRTTPAPSSPPPSQGPPTSDQTNQETLKGHCSNQRPGPPALLVALASLLLALRA